MCKWWVIHVDNWKPKRLQLSVIILLHVNFLDSHSLSFTTAILLDSLVINVNSPIFTQDFSISISMDTLNEYIQILFFFINWPSKLALRLVCVLLFFKVYLFQLFLISILLIYSIFNILVVFRRKKKGWIFPAIHIMLVNSWIFFLLHLNLSILHKCYRWMASS